ncbi:MAG: GFA family protein [Actinomycetota bacterium]
MDETVARRSGACLCGATRYESSTTDAVMQCHCVNCRRLTGNFVAAVRADWATTTIVDDSELEWFELGYARYGSCRACGSTLFFQAEETPDLVSVMVGTLDVADGLWLKSVWFSHEAQPHNPIPDVPLHEGNG